LFINPILQYSIVVIVKKSVNVDHKVCQLVMQDWNLAKKKLSAFRSFQKLLEQFKSFQLLFN